MPTLAVIIFLRLLHIVKAGIARAGSSDEHGYVLPQGILGHGYSSPFRFECLETGSQDRCISIHRPNLPTSWLLCAIYIREEVLYRVIPIPPLNSLG
jgi:hypothetical protein